MPVRHGPIIDSRKLEGFWIQAAVDNALWVVERYPDSELWQNTMITRKVPGSVRIEISVFIAGAMLDDATLQRWVLPSDLDPLGQYTFRLIHPNSLVHSACHTIKAYQDNVLLGEAYYSGILMPVE